MTYYAALVDHFDSMLLLGRLNSRVSMTMYCVVDYVNILLTLRLTLENVGFFGVKYLQKL